jgi:hypothetical protein
LSFFDEDDDPPRTSRTRVRSAPPPRRGRVATAGGPSDPQTVLVRRMIAGLAGVVILLLLFFLVRACNNTRQENALRDYNRQVSGLATASEQTGDQFFKQMDAAAQTSPAELYQSILGYKGEADNTLKQAQELSVPGDMTSAQQSLLILLELRRDGLASIAEQIRTALGDEGDAADKAIEGIAGNMRAFDASDVLYDRRVIPFIKAGFADAGVGGQTIAASKFLKEISWVSPPYVASRLDQQLSSDAGSDNGSGDSGRDPDEPTGPGLHGTGLDATSYGNVTLQPGTSNRLTYVEGQPFTVAFTNQGENDEFNVKVTLRIRPQSGNPITLNKTVPQVAQGEKATVELPLKRQPPFGAAVTIETEVAKVPGEKTSDNNKSSYPTLFAEG